MDNSKIVFLINDQVRAIRASYETTQASEVFKTFDESIEVDDYIIVQSEARHGFSVCKVREINVNVDFDSNTPIKWAAQRLAKEDFDKVLAQEAQAITAVQTAELRRKKEELRKSMFADHEDTIAALTLSNHKEA
jgi:hypothetical protein